VCRPGNVGREPVSKPCDTGEGGKGLAIKVYWWCGGSTRGVPLQGSPPVDEFGLGDAEAYLTSSGSGPNLPKCPLKGSDFRPV